MRIWTATFPVAMTPPAEPYQISLWVRVICYISVPSQIFDPFPVPMTAYITSERKQSNNSLMALKASVINNDECLYYGFKYMQCFLTSLIFCSDNSQSNCSNAPCGHDGGRPVS